MSGQSSGRPPLLSLVTLTIAVASLSTAIYQGWVQTRNLEIVQRDLARREQVRSCKDVIEAYFDVKLRIGLIADAATGSPPGLPDPVVQARMAVSRFGALGTYLANFQGEEARSRYTALTRELERVMGLARTAAGPSGMEALFEAADGLFYGMNEDCARSARQT